MTPPTGLAVKKDTKTLDDTIEAHPKHGVLPIIPNEIKPILDVTKTCPYERSRIPKLADCVNQVYCQLQLHYGNGKFCKKYLSEKDSQ